MNISRADLKILVIGDMSYWRTTKSHLPEIENTAFCSLTELGREILNDVNPDIILSSIVAGNFDIHEMINLLEKLGYDGAIRALCPPLPNPDMILHEIRSAHPEIDFDLILIPR